MRETEKFICHNSHSQYNNLGAIRLQPSSLNTWPLMLSKTLRVLYKCVISSRASNQIIYLVKQIQRHWQN